MTGGDSGHSTFWMKEHAKAWPSRWIRRSPQNGVLKQVVAWQAQPQATWLDNGPEFLADRFKSW